MALAVPPKNDRKRVKVYELRENDWFDRGTGFCTGQVINDEPRIYVESEDSPERMLLETRISKDDGYQKQQDTLIVWTESNGTDMALSFQEADGCAVIWEFVSQVQQQLLAAAGADDALSDDAIDSFSNPIMLPAPELGNLPDIEQVMRAASSTPAGRDAVSKFLIREEYIPKLLPLVTIAEDLESLPDLHRLCNIMKSLILLNDNTIIELVVTDGVILGVVGALEYDPDFPTHKANHRQYLSDRSRYKEVVPIKDPIIRRKIRHTWRLQYLKDVVLARILDDPTFSVLNSLIYFNQVDVVQHLQNNTPFLKELFAVFDAKNGDKKRKEDAVHFLHQCAAIAKNLQAPGRSNLFSNFINHGLFVVITFAVKHPNPAMRTTGIDILVALLDHDAIMMRGYMLKAVSDKRVPLTDTLIELLHVETDLGVKNQLADAIKVLLDPSTPLQDPLTRPGAEFLSKLRPQVTTPETFVQEHFDKSCSKLFIPLKELEGRLSMNDFTYQEVSLHAHLVDILTFFVRQHLFRSKYFVLSGSLAPRVGQLLTVPQKHLKLTALKFFRTCISLQDSFYHVQLTQSNAFELILNIVYETMPRDNLLNSACLELFEFIKRENIKPVILHVVENYRDKLKDITYVDTFQNLILRYDQMQGYNAELEASLFSQEEGDGPPRNAVNGGQRWQGVKEMDAAEEEYFNTSDDEEEEVHTSLEDRIQRSTEQMAEMAKEGERADNELMAKMAQRSERAKHPLIPNDGASPLVKPLVDYPDDDEDAMDMKPELQRPTTPENQKEKENAPPDRETVPQGPSLQPSPEISVPSTPPERLSEKRRREEDEEDDMLGKISSGVKRRNSSASSTGSGISGSLLRRKKSFIGVKKEGSSSPPTPIAANKKIAISLGTTGSKNAETKSGGDKDRESGS